MLTKQSIPLSSSTGKKINPSICSHQLQISAKQVILTKSISSFDEFFYASAEVLTWPFFSSMICRSEFSLRSSVYPQAMRQRLDYKTSCSISIRSPGVESYGDASVWYCELGKECQLMIRQLHTSVIKEQLAPFWVDMCHLSHCRLPSFSQI